MPFLKGHNPNRPAKGAKLAVEPIRNKTDIDKIKKYLANKPRDLAIFTLGINTNLRASDLVQLTVEQFKDKVPGDEIILHEKKTGKKRTITLSKAVYKAVQPLLDVKCHERLFRGQRGPMSPITVNAMVKTWTRAIGLKGQFGSHSLRKTWGYHQRVTFDVDIPTLMICFNHSSQKQTLEYLCISPDEIKQVYNNTL